MKENSADINTFNIDYSKINMNKQEIALILADNTDSLGDVARSFLDKNYESEIIKKEYINNCFVVVKKFTTLNNKIVEFKFKTFDEFYTFLNGDLSNCNIYDYDFKDIDLKKYNLNNVAINNSLLIENELYDDTNYNKVIRPLLAQSKEPSKDNIEDNISVSNEINTFPYLLESSYKTASIYYISDIHIDSKIENRFKENVTRVEVEHYIKTLADKMIDSMPSFYGREYILIAGDVSSSFELSKIFYQRLVERNKISSRRIICILGNHELWNRDRTCNNKVDDVINLYRKMFDDLEITFLQNELLIIDYDIKKIVSELELKNISESELKQITLESELTIFGGIGFSGYNPKYNASNHMYCDTVKTIEEDKQLTCEFNNLYTKLKKILYNRKLIILTHNPKQDWSSDNYNPNWIYVNGHTHQNTFEKSSSKQLYADNQIGYLNENVSLKWLEYSLKYNIFIDYKDGIHKIDLETYKKFYFKMGYHISCHLTGRFFLLKKQNIYMFIYKNDKDNIYILDGGKHNKLNINNMEYYYNNMDNYAKIIREVTKSFYNFIIQVSDYIKSIGGEGTIHGSIVDIDFYNHVYINIYDGKITPNYAVSMTDKIIYPTLEKLLEAKCPKLLKNMQNTKKNDLVLIKNELISANGYFSEDTRIYRESRIMKKFQALVESNIIRIWSDERLGETKLLISNQKLKYYRK